TYLSIYITLYELNLISYQPKSQRDLCVFLCVVIELASMSPAASSRWCPTPEQLMILEELYRTGIRTPNASQIQHITSQLSFYGKIEGKNVFYWFQNHKARDRQKLRRKLSKQLQQQQQQIYNHYRLQQNHLHYFEPPSAYAFH